MQNNIEVSPQKFLDIHKVNEDSLEIACTYSHF